ncbi:hypothetical protein RMCBS344292_18634 [Rhizopus microsporus]|nr:hypothetical protein RMCBS344292_18634 [Rhizopus microsporus]
MEEQKSSPSDPIRAANTTNDVFLVFFNCPPQYQPRAARVSDPPIYDGAPETLANYITHVKMCTNIDRSRFANEISEICFMTRHDFQPFLNALDTDQSLPEYMASLNVFITAACEVFGEVNTQFHIETNLLYLCQCKRSTTKYATTFPRLASQTQLPWVR